MAKRDFYDVLGIAKSADQSAIKSAYRKLAMQYHPDRNQGKPEAETKFKEVSEAYEHLKDEQKRAAYDQFGHAAFENGGGGTRDGGFGGFSDIFEEMFGGAGGGRSRQGPPKGNDRNYNLEIPLEDAFNGKELKIRVPVMSQCESCEGSGAADDSKIETCRQCKGAGRVRMQQGFFSMETTCSMCRGQGQTISKPCTTCRGQGLVSENKKVNVQIPKGIEDGMRMRIAGKGDAAPKGGVSGDLYLTIGIKAHEIFQREGAHIFCQVPIPMAEAALGTTVEVPSVDGTKAKVKIPAGVQTGKQMRLKGKGMTVLNRNGRGDMIIETFIETPIDLTPEQRELLERFAEKSGKPSSSGQKDNHPQSSGFFTKVKEIFEDIAN